MGKSIGDYWARVGALGAFLGGVGVFFGVVSTSAVFLVAIYGCLTIALLGLAQWLWCRLPSVRARREKQALADEFREFAPALETALNDVDGGALAPAIKDLKDEEEAPRAYRRTQIVLMRLDKQFGIPVPNDPTDFLLPDAHQLFAEVVAYAYAGDLESARGLATRREWLAYSFFRSKPR